jgi:hypothetical protein
MPPGGVSPIFRSRWSSCSDGGPPPTWGIARLRRRVQLVVNPFPEAEREQFLAALHVAVLSVASMEGHENVLFVIRPDRWLTADYSGGV